jgi:hypothetical protein
LRGYSGGWYSPERQYTVKNIILEVISYSFEVILWSDNHGSWYKPKRE